MENRDEGAAAEQSRSVGRKQGVGQMSAATKGIRRGRLVVYRTPDHRAYQAIVRSLHRDNSATVEARFSLDGYGRQCGSYIGHRYRVPISMIEAQVPLSADVGGA